MKTRYWWMCAALAAMTQFGCGGGGVDDPSASNIGRAQAGDEAGDDFQRPFMPIGGGDGTHLVNLTVVGQGQALGRVPSVPVGLDCDVEQGQCYQSFAQGANIQLFALPEPGSQFVSWGGACSGQSASVCELTQLEMDQTVVATFARLPVDPGLVRVSLIGSAAQNASITSSPEGMVCSDGVCEGRFSPGQTVQLMAVANGGMFTGWFGTELCESLGPTSANPSLPVASDNCTVKAGELTAPLEARFSTVPQLTMQDELLAQSCDISVSAHCLYPFPNNHFTARAPAGSTGLLVNLDPLQMPRNAAGVPVLPVEWNRHDGFSVGPKLVTYLNGVDYPQLVVSNAPQLTKLAKSLDINRSSIVLLDAETLEPQLIWAEPERSKFVAEHDSLGVDDSNRTLTIRVGKNLEYGKRYLVAIRNIREADGTLLEADDGFRIYRDKVETSVASVENRRPAMEDIFTRLADAGIPRYQLVQAWDFTTISQENLTERVLAMRDAVYEQIASGNYDFDIQIGDVAGQDAITAISLGEELVNLFASGLPETFEGSGAGFAQRLQNLVAKLSNQGQASAEDTNPEDHYRPYRTINGSLSVPCFLNTPNCAPGGSLVYQPDASGLFGDGLPDAIPGSTMRATFTCRIPKSVFENGVDDQGNIRYQFGSVTRPARASLYGHGLLGSRGEVNNSSHVAWASREANLMFCAMNWTGFATEDVPTAVGALLDMNSFPRFIDRQLQGMLNWLVLQEALVAAPGENGFMDVPAFQDEQGKPLYALDFESNPTQGGLFYDGNSQGGIMGGALVAISPRICHAVLGVPGMNYSTLLRRSKDFQATQTLQESVEGSLSNSIANQSPPEPEIGYSQPFDTSYADPLDQAFLMSLIQMVWDRGETNGYAKYLGAGNSLRSHPITGAQQGEAQCDKRVLLHVAFGDHQVSITTAEVMARTANMPRVENGPAEGRHPDNVDAFTGIEPIQGGGLHQQSALVTWDSGDLEVAAPPVENTPPRLKSDPHEHARRAIEAREQKMMFLRSGGGIRPTCGNSQFTESTMPFCFSGESERVGLQPSVLADLDRVRRQLD